MGQAKPPARNLVYQLKIMLAESNPPIWRRIQVPGNTLLPQLHLMLQAAMGWYNCHLHGYTIDSVNYGERDPDFEEPFLEEETRVRLDRVVSRAGISFSYVYDFGDNWEHDILVEEVAPANPGTRYPICLDGQRACPPEDCGGIWGYQEEFLAAIHDPDHEEHERMLEWVGGSFDPEAFDLGRTNDALKQYRLLGLYEI